MAESKKMGKTAPKGMGKTAAKAVAKAPKKMTDAEKAKLKKDLKPLKNDKPMLKPLKNDKPARGAKAGSSVVSSVVKRAKTVAREARDVKTAVGTSLRDIEQNVRRAGMGVKPTGKNVGGNLKQQLKEVGTAIKSGKKGTSSDMYNKPGAYNKGTKRK